MRSQRLPIWFARGAQERAHRAELPPIYRGLDPFRNDPERRYFFLLGWREMDSFFANAMEPISATVADNYVKFIWDRASKGVIG